MRDHLCETTAGDRWEGESDKAYAAFCVYRNLPPRQRTLRQVAEVLGYQISEKLRRQGKVGGSVSRWSYTFRWRERAAHWDAEQQWLRRQELVERRRCEEDATFELHDQMKEMVRSRLLSLNPEDLKPMEAVRMLEALIRMENRMLPRLDDQALMPRPTFEEAAVMIAEQAGQICQIEAIDRDAAGAKDSEAADGEDSEVAEVDESDPVLAECSDHDSAKLDAASETQPQNDAYDDGEGAERNNESCEEATNPPSTHPQIDPNRRSSFLQPDPVADAKLVANLCRSANKKKSRRRRNKVAASDAGISRSKSGVINAADVAILPAG